MAKEQFQLQIVTPERTFFEDVVDLAVFKASEGELGIEYDHIPLTTLVDIGMIRIRQGKDEKLAAVHGGFAEIQPEMVTIITDSAEWPEEIDVERAKAAKERAESRLKEKDPSEVNLVRAKASIRRALTRIELVENVRK